MEKPEHRENENDRKEANSGFQGKPGLNSVCAAKTVSPSPLDETTENLKSTIK